MRRGEQGAALIVALWVIGLLSMLVGSFAFDAHVESRITSFYRKRTKALYLARSGLDVADMLLAGSAELGRDRELTPEQEADRWHSRKRQLADGLPVRGLEIEVGDGTIRLDLVPEPARRNVNMLGEEAWERVLDVGGVPEELWPEMIASFLDWTDGDDTPRLEGAESEDYYAQLDPPYRADNAPLDTVEELLLVKGFTKPILSGGPVVLEEGFDPIRIRGIGGLLTTYGDGRVNVNAASRRVLMTLPEVDELVARAVIEEREGWLDPEGARKDTTFSDVGDFMSRIPGLDPRLREMVSVDSKVYGLRTAGIVQGVERSIRCVVRHDGTRLTILRWTESE